MGLPIRKKIWIQGIVQGVGFRPFVYRHAVRENLKGFVTNTSRGVHIEVEGKIESIDRFIRELGANPPVQSKITRMEISDLPVHYDAGFQIRSSDEGEDRSALISPDIGICDDCLRELFNPRDRRFLYPFINCTNCGPRYTIIKDIPYDRPKTTMADFNMCPDCLREYENPLDRRFHAQPNACPVCGPEVWLTDSKGNRRQEKDPIHTTVRLLKEGKIIAIKGIGGFHLACDAVNETAVTLLRLRKNREEKPLAVMAKDISSAEIFSIISSQEKDLLLTSRRPIVLLMKKKSFSLASALAPRNRFVGVMLPYTPLHYLLLHQLSDPLVMTSGNLSEEPIAIGNKEALGRLGGIADFFLMHNRDIHLRSDDSVTRIIAGLPRPVRRSRGYVPVPVFLRQPLPSVLAVGAELKNTLCFTKEDRAFLSQHIGDLENVETLEFFEESVTHLRQILEIKPSVIAHDLHPDYLSTQWAKEQNLPLVGVQHHHAHIASCLADNGRNDQVIGLALDGTGYGEDGHIWGGEILIADLKEYRRVGHMANRPMPGGALAIKEPWRMAVAYAWEACKNREDYPEDHGKFIKWIDKLPFVKHIEKKKILQILQMIQKDINTPLTSSLGRLFDGVAAMAGLRSCVAYEGQAALELEMAIEGDHSSAPINNMHGYPFSVCKENGQWIISPDSVILNVYEDVQKEVPISIISRNFHIGLVHVFADICKRIRCEYHHSKVAFSGGCFQNRFLMEHLLYELHKTDFEVITHSQVPTNDGGLALGQAVIAATQS